jgi:LAO/AO transport system kinase
VQLWDHVRDHHRRLAATGAFAVRRREQQVKWMWALVEEQLRGRLAADPKLKVGVPELEAAVAEGTLSPALAADEIVQTLGL